MNGYNFTERVRQNLAMAREEAAALKNEYISTEHILLGLLRTDGVGATVLQNLNVDIDVLRGDVIRRVKPGTKPTVGPDLPYTSRGKKCLELAMSEARELDHPYVGTEHLLLGLLREEKGIAAQALVAAGVTLETARAEMVRILGHDPDRTERVKSKRPMESARPEFWHGMPEPFGTVMGNAFVRAKDRGADRPTLADMLEAIIRTSPVVSAAFASREIEVDALIADIRSHE
jgi:ATP-dependent Clp protease ATP-binding subunit ClpA